MRRQQFAHLPAAGLPVTQAKALAVRRGMTLAQVEKIMGFPGEPPHAFTFKSQGSKACLTNRTGNS